MAASAGLTVYAAAIYIDKHVEFIFAGGYHQRGTYDINVFALWKIFIQTPAVYDNLSTAVAHINAGNRCFSPAGSNTKISNHNIPL
jgi:hypothetical protein